MEVDISRSQIFHKKTKAVSIRCMVYCALIFEVPSYRSLCSTWLRSLMAVMFFYLILGCMNADIYVQDPIKDYYLPMRVS